jgi:hypothetical protein
VKSVRHDAERAGKAAQHDAEQRKEISRLIKKLTNGAASNRQIARTLGVNRSTIDRDTSANAPPALNAVNDLMLESGANAPRPLSGEQAARLVEEEMFLGPSAVAQALAGQPLDHPFVAAAEGALPLLVVEQPAAVGLARRRRLSPSAQCGHGTERQSEDQPRRLTTGPR